MISDLGSSRDAKADAKAPKLAEVPAVLIRGGTSKGSFSTPEMSPRVELNVTASS